MQTTNKQGEIFFCGEDSQGTLECLTLFKGKNISSLGGGYNKLYIIQDTEENEGVVSSLHPPEFDEHDTVFAQELDQVADPFEYITAFDNKGTFRQIASGKKHLLVLTEAGQLYSWGYGEFGVLGLSGATVARVPQIIKSLSDKVVSQVACGEYHTLALTNTGDVYAWGRGFEGQLGIARSDIPPPPQYDKKEQRKEEQLQKRAQILKKNQPYLDESDEEEMHEAVKRTQAAATSKQNQVYFPVQTATTPRYIKTFFNNPMKYIACGAYSSFSINTKGALYGWGEAKLGQIGVGRVAKVDIPQRIEIRDRPVILEYRQNSLIHTKITLKSDGFDNLKSKTNLKSGNEITNRPQSDLSPTRELQDQEVDKTAGLNGTDDINNNPLISFKSVAAGFGYTLALSEDGVIFTWGLNCKAQLGVGDKKTRYKPSKLAHDQLSNPLPKFTKIACGYYTSFAIDENGKLYSWGGGSLGHKADKLQEMPRIVEAYTENRTFTDMFCTMKSSVFFAPIRVISIQPKSGPSSGGTMLSLLGTGFTDTGLQKIRFSYKGHQKEVSCTYNAASEGLHLVTPKFDDLDLEEEMWPLEAEVYLALDGVNYVLAEEKFFIYSSNIQIISMNPKCASIKGGLSLTMDLNIDPVTVSKINVFTIGFQARQLGLEESKKDDASFQDKDMTTTNSPTKMRNRGGLSREAINPLGITVASADLDKEDWICVRGTYDKGKITCEIPSMTSLSEKLLHFNIDVSLNGQQFTGLPSAFRFYDVKVTKIQPNNSPSSGDTYVILEGRGFMDSDTKKLRFRSKFGERLVDLVWIKEKKQYSFFVPPISWLFGGNIPTQEQIEELKQEPPIVEITLNHLEWLPVGRFYYYDPEYERITVAAIDEKLSEEEKKIKWLSDEPELDPFATCKNDAEKDKKQKELTKIMEQEDNEIANGFRKAGSYLYIRGRRFIKTDNLSVQFIYGNSGVVTQAVYKNHTRLGVIVPEIDELPPGINEVQVEISYNGQKFSSVQKKIKVLAFDKSMTPEQRVAFENEEVKKAKKGGKK